MSDDDLKKQTIETGRALGSDALKIARWSVYIYPISIIFFSSVFAFGAYFAGILYMAAWLAWLCVVLAFFMGGVVGFFIAGLIISSLVGDLMFDASWQTAKLGWKAGKQVRKSDKKA